jgi:hypothetical protein
MAEASNGSKNGGNLWSFAKGLINVTRIVSEIAWGGVKRIKVKSAEFILLMPAMVLLIFVATYDDYAHLKFLHLVWSVSSGIFRSSITF